MKQQLVHDTQRSGRWLSAAVIGALAMYFSDPAQGRRRRALAQDKMRSVMANTGQVLDRGWRDLSHRLQGVRALVAKLQDQGMPDDTLLEARVRARLGHAVSNPHALSVAVQHGQVRLQGPVLAREKPHLMDIVRATRGVRGVEDQLDAHEEAGGNPALQAGNDGRIPFARADQAHWTPALRSMAATGGSALALYGLSRKSPTGLLLAAAGVALAARGASNTPLARLLDMLSPATALTLQKTIDIKAPPESVFDTWQRLENFPHFMSHVIEVRDLAQQRSHWVVKGPAGSVVEWDSVMTDVVRPRLLAWQSEAGAAVEHAGTVRFSPGANGGTRVMVRMTYRPPAGAFGAGDALAVWLGNDPMQALDEDLQRMKNFIERGIRPYDAADSQTMPSQLLH